MDQDNSPKKAYDNPRFLNSPSARPVRILSEYLEPEARFERYSIDDTIVFMGSSRACSLQQAQEELARAKREGGDLTAAEQKVRLSHYYEAAQQLAQRFTEGSKQLPQEHSRFVVCTGAGPGIMEAAIRGASAAKGINIGLSISLPNEQLENDYITRELTFEFHYFFMRKFWFIYLAKALIFFPGGFGTLDELFEVLTLLQTGKTRKYMPVVLFGKAFWEEVINFPALVEYGTIDVQDLNLILITDSLDEAFEHITTHLDKFALDQPGGML